MDSRWRGVGAAPWRRRLRRRSSRERRPACTAELRGCTRNTRTCTPRSRNPIRRPGRGSWPRRWPVSTAQVTPHSVAIAFSLNIVGSNTVIHALLSSRYAVFVWKAGSSAANSRSALARRRMPISLSPPAIASMRLPSLKSLVERLERLRPKRIETASQRAMKDRRRGSMPLMGPISGFIPSYVKKFRLLYRLCGLGGSAG